MLFYNWAEYEYSNKAKFIPLGSACKRQWESVIVTSTTKCYQFSYISYIKLHTLGWLNEKAMNAMIRLVKGCKSRGDRHRLLLRAMRIFRNILRAGVVRMTDTANFDTTTTGGEGFYRMIPTSWPSRTWSSGWRFLSNDPVASSFVNSQKVPPEQISARENFILLIYMRH